MKVLWNGKKWEELPPQPKGGHGAVPNSLYLDPVLKKNLDNVKKFIKKDWDYVFTIDGEEGSGKSVLAMQLAYYCTDTNFHLENVCVTSEQFKEQITKAPKYGAVIFDEAFRGLGSRSAMNKTNRVIVSMLQEIRQKNLFVFIVLPSVWDLDSHVVLHRTKGLFHTYTDAKKNRGYFKFFNKANLKYMMRNVRTMKYDYPRKALFMGRFTNFYPVSEQSYRQKKHKALIDQGASDEKKETVAQKRKRAKMEHDLKEAYKRLRQFESEHGEKLFSHKICSEIFNRGITMIKRWERERKDEIYKRKKWAESGDLTTKTPKYGVNS